MDFSTPLNCLCLIVCFCNFLVALLFLTIAIVFRQRCFTFPTLLACNTALGALLYSTNSLVVLVYMFIWDRQTNPTVDIFCSVRAYLYHSTTAWIHHSLVLQAIEKFCKIKNIELLTTPRRQIAFVLAQWTLDFTFDLPVLLTGNMPKMVVDNMCFVSLFRMDLVSYMAAISFLMTGVSLSLIYRRLVNHVRQVSVRASNSQQAHMRRDLVMVRRIVLLNSELAIAGLPVTILVIVSAIRADLLPARWMRGLILIVFLPLSPMLSMLFWFTPALRQTFEQCRNRVRPAQFPGTSRRHPPSDNPRF